MNKQQFTLVKQLLTGSNVYANRTDYSLSIVNYSCEDFEYYRIFCFPNDYLVAFHEGYVAFFLHVCEVAMCSLSFCVRHGVVVAYFY